MDNKKNKIVIVLDRLRSAFNTGNIYRIADAVGVDEIITCGYTPSPPHPKLSKTAMGAENYIPTRQFSSSLEAVDCLRSEGIEMILAVETTENATCAWEMNYKFPLAIILGNEVLGIPEDTLNHSDGIINLPMFGYKHSINVGNCAAVILYSIKAYQKKYSILDI